MYKSQSGKTASPENHRNPPQLSTQVKSCPTNALSSTVNSSVLHQKPTCPSRENAELESHPCWTSLAFVQSPLLSPVRTVISSPDWQKQTILGIYTWNCAYYFFKNKCITDVEKWSKQRHWHTLLTLTFSWRLEHQLLISQIQTLKCAAVPLGEKQSKTSAVWVLEWHRKKQRKGEGRIGSLVVTWCLFRVHQTIGWFTCNQSSD